MTRRTNLARSRDVGLAYSAYIRVRARAIWTRISIELTARGSHAAAQAGKENRDQKVEVHESVGAARARARTGRKRRGEARRDESEARRRSEARRSEERWSRVSERTRPTPSCSCLPPTACNFLAKALMRGLARDGRSPDGRSRRAGPKSPRGFFAPGRSRAS